MEIITMKLADLVKPEKNVRIHTEQQLKEFQRSVEMFGQIRPIVVDENNVILAGNGLYDTFVMMGKESAEVYKYKNLTENQKKKLMIADNKIFNLGVDNLESLNNFLEELQGDLDIPGFDEDILKEMVADAEEVTEIIALYGKLEADEIQEIRSIGEKQEKREEKIHLESKASPKNEEVREKENTLPVNKDAEDKLVTDEQRYLRCPKCGEKIWL